METATMSSKGQVVIPKAVRDAHRWDAGTQLVFEEGPEGVVVRAAGEFAQTTLAAGLGCAGYRGTRKSDEDIREALDRAARKAWGVRR